MKKTKYYAWMMAAALAMGGCSDEMDGPGGEGTTIEGETGYVKIALNLPSSVGTRANGNDDFDDGDDVEYNVNDVILALFYGTDESTATFNSAYSLEGTWTDDVDDDNVIRYLSHIREIPQPGTGQTVYALVIVNNSGLFSVSGAADGGTTGTGLKFNNTDLTAGSSTFASFYNTVLNSSSTGSAAMSKIASRTSDENKGNFLMLNAPTSNIASTTNMGSNDTHSVTTLVPLTVYPSENDAEIGGATDIYVERAVAKVTVSATATTIDADGANYDELPIEFTGWMLQNTNNKMYVVRNVYATDASTLMPSTSPAWKTWDSYYVGTEVNRFYGEVSNPYRVYWGIDPNYFSEIASANLAENFTIISAPYSSIDESAWTSLTTDDSTNPLYCAENTTTAANMNDNQLTSVLLRATVGEDEDLFILDNELTVYKEDDFLTLIKSFLTGTNALPTGQDLKIKDNASGMIIESTTTGSTTLAEEEETTAKTLDDLIEITGGSSTSLSETQKSAIMTGVGGTIKYYKEGICYYYTSLIQHFGDNPTKYEGSTEDVDYTGTYGEKKYLGRYGVLRNNWYEMTVSGVSGIGSPDIPEIPDTPADETESFINARINILSWAKRAQDVVLTD